MAEIKISVKNNTPNINVSSGGKKITVDSELSWTSENPVQNKVVTAAWANKVDEVEGKGLSSNDYTTEEKEKLTNLPTMTELSADFDGKVDKAEGKGLSTEDYTTEDKQKLGNLLTASEMDNRYDLAIYKVSTMDIGGDAKTFCYPTVKAVVDYAQEKTTIEEHSPEAFPFTVGENNTEYRLTAEAITTLAIDFPNGEYDKDYIEGLVFNSGSTPTHVSYTSTGIIQWIGTDCFISDDNKSVFKPSANIQYDIVFYYNGGNYIVGLVNGYKVATANQEANA